jgi:hypothetical protein
MLFGFNVALEIFIVHPADTAVLMIGDWNHQGTIRILDQADVTPA